MTMRSCRLTPGDKIVYQTRRHWYEVIYEAADMVYFGSTILLISFGAAMLWDRLIWLCLLALYPLGHFVTELILWNSEWFFIVESSNGRRSIVKVSGIFRPTEIKDPVGFGMAHETVTPWLGKYLGFTSVHLANQNHIYVDGKRVPERLIREIDKVVGKGQANTPDMAVLNNLSEWRDRDLISPVEARAAVSRWVAGA